MNQISEAQRLYRNRLRSMMAVDEMVGRLVATLQETGELSFTYIVFTSDNGVHAGQHRLGEGKRLTYEEDIRVPLIVRGLEFQPMPPAPRWSSTTTLPQPSQGGPGRPRF